MLEENLATETKEKESVANNFNNLEEMFDAMRELEISSFHPYDDPEALMVGYIDEYSKRVFMVSIDSLDLGPRYTEEAKKIFAEGFKTSEGRIAIGQAASRTKSPALLAGVYLFRRYQID